MFRHLTPTAAAVASLFLSLACSVARADLLTVTSSADDGSPGTLRSLIAMSKAGDNIACRSNSNIELHGAELAIDHDLTISG